MSGIEFADFSRRRPKVSDPNVGKLQSREDVVSPRACGRSLGQSLLLVTAVTALSAQLVGKRGPKRIEFVRSITTISNVGWTKSPSCLSGEGLKEPPKRCGSARFELRGVNDRAAVFRRRGARETRPSPPGLSWALPYIVWSFSRSWATLISRSKAIMSRQRLGITLEGSIRDSHCNSF